METVIRYSDECDPPNSEKTLGKVLLLARHNLKGMSLGVWIMRWVLKDGSVLQVCFQDRY